MKKLILAAFILAAGIYVHAAAVKTLAACNAKTNAANAALLASF